MIEQQQKPSWSPRSWQCLSSAFQPHIREDMKGRTWKNVGLWNNGRGEKQFCIVLGHLCVPVSDTWKWAVLGTGSFWMPVHEVELAGWLCFPESLYLEKGYAKYIEQKLYTNINRNSSLSFLRRMIFFSEKLFYLLKIKTEAQNLNKISETREIKFIFKWSRMARMQI